MRKSSRPSIHASSAIGFGSRPTLLLKKGEAEFFARRDATHIGDTAHLYCARSWRAHSSASQRQRLTKKLPPIREVRTAG